MSPQPPEVRAAGGVIVRDGRVAVVHRPHREDLTLPKGKLDPGEGWRAAAEREVLEETGLTCALEDELPAVRYADHRGRAKTVRYWTMRVLAGDFVPNDEVDELRWLEPGQALAALTYPADRDLLAAWRAGARAAAGDTADDDPVPGT